jgi:glycosyltransferase involved in cell wall biosynthesis
MKTISIAMATFNGERFIRGQLDSLARQTLSPFELVITDDGSSDSTLAIVDEFAKQAQFPVRVHRNSERLGYVRNFMHCAHLCKGEFIAFADQDDIWDEEKLNCVASIFDEQNPCVVFHNFRLIDKNGILIDPAVETNRYQNINHWTIVPGLTIVFHRDLLAHTGLIDQSIDPGRPPTPMAHDQWIYFLGHSFGSLHYLDRCLLSYRQHDSNLFGLAYSAPPSTFRSVIKPIAQALVGNRTLLLKKNEILHKTLFGQGVSSRGRAEILRTIRDDKDCRHTAQLANHIAYYESVARTSMLRAMIYEGSSVLDRLMSLLKCIGAGAYGFSYRGGKDILLDLLFGACSTPMNDQRVADIAR